MAKLTKGFSLLEVLLVLSVIALMMVAGMRLSEQHIMRVKVENTVLQMQSLVEFAQRFYGTNGRWPSTADMDPMQLNNCPWKHGNTQDPCYTVDGSGSFFSLTLTVPSLAGINVNVPTMIAARLPSATFTANTVQVAIPAPGLLPASSSLSRLGYDPNQPTLPGILVAVFQTHSAGASRDFPTNPPITLVDCPNPRDYKEVFFLLPNFDNAVTITKIANTNYQLPIALVGTCAAYQNKDTSLCDLSFTTDPNSAPCYLPGIINDWPMNNGGLANPTIVKPGDSNTIYPYACSVQPQGINAGDVSYLVHSVEQPILAFQYCVTEWG